MTTTLRAERRAKATQWPLRGLAKPARPSRETRLGFAPSKSAQADLEPRRSVPLGDRPTYLSDEAPT